MSISNLPLKISVHHRNTCYLRIFVRYLIPISFLSHSYLRNLEVHNLSISCSVFLSLSGKSGSKTFVAKRFLPRGEKEKDGVMVLEINCTYFWAPLAEIDFSVGVVVPVSHAKDQLNSLSIPPGKFLKNRNIYRGCCNNVCHTCVLYK